MKYRVPRPPRIHKPQGDPANPLVWVAIAIIVGIGIVDVFIYITCVGFLS